MSKFWSSLIRLRRRRREVVSQCEPWLLIPRFDGDGYAQFLEDQDNIERRMP
jgi:hypothetical protein